MELSQIVAPLLAWYQKEKRDLPWRHQVTPYRVWVSEIMLQQTRVEAVKGYFIRFMEALPDIAALAQCPESQLLKLWEGLGYYNRVRNLQKAAQIVQQRYDGKLPCDYHALLQLPGIGPYTAGAIASIAFELPYPAVDGNVLRVISRITASDADIADAACKKAIEQALLKIMPLGHSGAFNQSLMELGATVCVPNGQPLCLCCPIRTLCEGYQQGIAQDLPVKTAKKPRKVEERTVLVLVRDRKVAIRRRPSRGLLAGLWELPAILGRPTQAQLIAHVREMGLEPVRMEPLIQAKHIFTHIEWHMSGVRITVEEAEPSQELVWAEPEQLRDTYALPSAFAAYLQPIREG